MGMRWCRYRVPVLSLILISLHTCLQGALARYSLDSYEACSGKKTINWISKSDILTGKSRNQAEGKDCQVIFGVKSSTKTSPRLVLEIKSAYIRDCGVTLQINESRESDFELTTTNQEIYAAECNTVSPKVIYARPKHYLIIRLTRLDLTQHDYNMYINVTTTETMPESGPPFYVVVIVSFTAALVVLMAVYLLYKYLVYKCDNWRDQRAEEAMTRAISIYNASSQDDRLDRHDTDMAYVEPGDERRRSPAQSGPEIAFVHSDGRVERFRTGVSGASSPATPRSRRQPRATPQAASHTTPSTHQLHDFGPVALPSKSKLSADESSAEGLVVAPPRTKQKGARPENSRADLSEEGGADMPPSYAEALHMPVPAELETRSASGSETLSDLESGADLLASHQGCLRIDYVNIDRTDGCGDGPGGGPVGLPDGHEEVLLPQQSPDPVASRILNS